MMACIDSAKSGEIVTTAIFREKFGQSNVECDPCSSCCEVFEKVDASGNFRLKRQCPNGVECGIDDCAPLKQEERSINFHGRFDALGGDEGDKEDGPSPQTFLRRIEARGAHLCMDDRYTPLADVLLNPKNEEAIAAFVPPPLGGLTDDGILFDSAELREVTTVFVKLDTYKMEYDEGEPIYGPSPCLQTFFAGAQVAVAESGGFMRQFLIDDKGCVLIAMWGVPQFTHPNNTSRALYFCRLLSNHVDGMGHTCSIGMTTGTVFCGCIGSLLRREYVGIGHTVNMAARLMGKAKGRVLVDESSYALLPSHGRDQLELLEPIRLKNVEGYVRPYKVIQVSQPKLSFEDDRTMLAISRGNMPRHLNPTVMDKVTDVLNEISNSASANTPHRHGSGVAGLPQRHGPGVVGLPQRHGSGIAAFFGGETSSPIMSTKNPGRSRYFGGVKNAATSGGAERSVSRYLAASFKLSSRVSDGVGEGGANVIFLVVYGGTGMGKSTVCEYVRAGARRRSMRHISTRCHPDDIFVPMKLLKAIVVGLIGEQNFRGVERPQMILKRLLKTAHPSALRVSEGRFEPEGSVSA